MVNVYFYFIGFVSIFLVGDIFKNTSTKYIFFLFLLFLIFGGNRLNGADWINYTNVYSSISDDYSLFEVVFNGPFEWAFSLWMWILSLFGIPYEGLVASIGFFNSCCLIWLLSKVRVKNIGFCICIIFLLDGWTLYHEQIRQAVSVTLGLISIYKYLNLERNQSYLILFLALGFHSSALILIIFYILANAVINNNDKPLRFIYLFYFSSVVVIFGVILLIISKVGFWGVVGLSRIQDKLNFYFADDLSRTSLINIGILVYVINFFILYLFKSVVERSRNRWLSVSWSIAILWCFLGPWLRVFAILGRFEHFLLIFFPFAVCSYMNCEYKMKCYYAILLRFFVVLYSATFFVRITLHPGHGAWVKDYQNVFFSPLLNSELSEFDNRRLDVCDKLEDYDNLIC